MGTHNTRQTQLLKTNHVIVRKVKPQNSNLNFSKGKTKNKKTKNKKQKTKTKTNKTKPKKTPIANPLKSSNLLKLVKTEKRRKLIRQMVKKIKIKGGTMSDLHKRIIK